MAARKQNKTGGKKTAGNNSAATAGEKTPSPVAESSVADGFAKQTPAPAIAKSSTDKERPVTAKAAGEQTPSPVAKSSAPDGDSPGVKPTGAANAQRAAAANAKSTAANAKSTTAANAKSTNAANAKPTGAANAKPTGAANAKPTDAANAKSTTAANAKSTTAANAKPTGAANANPKPTAAALQWSVFAVAFVVLCFCIDNSAGWAATSTRAVLAVRLDHSAVAPLYDVLAGAAALLPFGEPAFRLELLGALLGAFTLMGVVAVARAWLPKEPAAGVIAAVMLLLAPPFREALATPQMLAACGLVWAIAFGKRDQLRATFLMSALVLGAEPWLGIAAVFAAAIRFTRFSRTNRKPEVAIAVGAIGIAIVLLWFGAVGSLPGFHISLADAVAVSGRGAAAVVIGAGLLGLGVGVMTNLPNARVLAAIALVVAVHEIDVGDNAVPMLTIFALGTAIVASAILHLVANQLAGWQRNAAVLACGAPLLIAAFAMGIAVDDPRDTPRRLANDLVDQIPTGQGVFVTTRAPSWFTLQYERTIAGMRPDLELVPPLGSERADVIVADALRAGKIVGSDASAFGRLDERFARPRGRAFQLLGAAPSEATPVDPPADYDSAIGETQSVALAIERAQHEAASGRLAAAARAVGLEKRFGAADLAVLSASLPTRDRPPLFGYLPLDTLDRDTLDVFGDDLAWIANIPLVDPPITATKPKKLHALWRKIFVGTLKPDSPEIAALGTDAVAATKLINFGAAK